MHGVFAGSSRGLIGSSRLHLGVCSLLHVAPVSRVLLGKGLHGHARRSVATACALSVSGAVREQRHPGFGSRRARSFGSLAEVAAASRKEAG